MILWSLVALLAVWQLVTVPAFAQTTTLDLDPPAIDHDALETGRAGELQTFSALVADDRGVRQVVLFYRGKGAGEYASVQMREIARTGRYTATISTTPEQSIIHYYIEAVDTGGNRVLKGFPFYPLARNLELPDPITVANPVQAEAPKDSSESAGKSKVLYILLGVAALGLLAAASGGSSPGSDPELVPLNITVTPP